ncbi:hypothetical protein LZD49_26280 [Dyadobacter sp. CY261]|uniref:hypothetical protein n=1 Tax=Dyadobacter sp. CY261 TaxID=2907203 RepID=UPI001F1B23CB|nr:hypothetical protein [Dyadobacter sp. CY261]MCF0074017.1 hypothetical protein [Dyadobacter sp. CY261]
MENKPITAEALSAAGFKTETVAHWSGEKKETGLLVLHGWDPVPRIQFSEPVAYASIKSQQWKLKNQEDLDKFINKYIPIFCEKQ